MVTDLGKILRIIRINTGDSMRNMAEKLKLSVSYLSAIENGKRNVPSDFEEKIASNYTLSKKDTENLREAISKTTGIVKVNITELSDKQKKILYALSKDEIDNDTLEELCLILKKKGTL